MHLLGQETQKLCRAWDTVASGTRWACTLVRWKTELILKNEFQCCSHTPWQRTFCLIFPLNCTFPCCSSSLTRSFICLADYSFLFLLLSLWICLKSVVKRRHSINTIRNWINSNPWQTNVRCFWLWLRTETAKTTVFDFLFFRKYRFEIRNSSLLAELNRVHSRSRTIRIES